jgi:putative ABC transport system substrate-binding protein
LVAVGNGKVQRLRFRPAARALEGQNVGIEHRWAGGQYDRLPALAAELVRGGVAVIFASGGQPPLQAAIAAINTIPIVFMSGDPVSEGYVASFNRPGGKVMGVGFLAEEVAAKRFELMREFLPKAKLTTVPRRLLSGGW